MTLGELLLQATGAQKATGNIAGTCMVCSLETPNGLPARACVSGNFTGWNRFFFGNCLCPDCAFLFSDQTFRKKSWVAAPGYFETFKNDQAAKVLFNPPEPPFFVYIAKQGQRQSWLSCLHRIAQNKNRYFFSHEKYDIPILFERKAAEKYIEQALRALEDYGITKTELLAAQFKPKTWQRAIEDGYREFLEKLEAHKGELLWEVIVDVARPRKQDGGASSPSLQCGAVDENEDIEEPARYLQPPSAGSQQAFDFV